MSLARLVAVCAVITALALLSSHGVSGQDRKDKEPKYKNTLPRDWSRLKLTEAQQEEIHRLQREHKDKRWIVLEEIARLDAELIKAKLKLLTEEQRKKLREMDSVAPDPKEKKDAKPEDRLPVGWWKLDLTDKQKEDVLKLQREHQAAVDPLKEKMAILDAELVKKRMAVLTDEQRAMLRKIVAGDLPPEEKKDKK